MDAMDISREPHHVCRLPCEEGLMLAWRSILYALGSAALFGASTPMAKLLLGSGVSPWLLAGLLYLGSGVGLAVVMCVRRLMGGRRQESPLMSGDLPWLIAAFVSGGLAAPVLLMIGLSSTEASTAALLLNLEGVATMAIAWLIFREGTDARIVIGALAIVGGAIILAWEGGPRGLSWAAVAIAAAAIAWAVDNNLTRKIANADPIQIAMIKGIVAGAANLALAIVDNAAVPAPGQIGASAAIGFFGYGVSLVLFVLALRHLGAARTGAYFAIAPFVGVVIAVTVLSEPVTPQLIVAGVLMGMGLWLHVSEHHEHQHQHAIQDHNHAHTHDEHHRHEHDRGDLPGEPHAHRHTHEPIVHGHPHYPDLHHEHPHRH
jgi:drug/metabolite transporter (DMT)-like permease